MGFRLQRPCVDCPFLVTRDFPLAGNRAAEIALDVERGTFACHKTVYRDQPRNRRGQFQGKLPEEHCAGVLQIMRNTDRWGDMQQIAMRLGLFDPSALGHDPVYPTLRAFVEHMGGKYVPWRGEYRKET